MTLLVLSRGATTSPMPTRIAIILRNRADRRTPGTAVMDSPALARCAADAGGREHPLTPPPPGSVVGHEHVRAVADRPVPAGTGGGPARGATQGQRAQSRHLAAV